MRRAASLAIDRKGINDALTLGYSLITGNPIVPDHYEFFWQPPDAGLRPGPGQAAAGRGRLSRTASTPAIIIAIRSYANIGEAVLDNLQAVGIRAKLRPIERAAFIKAYRRKDVQEHHPGRSRRFRQRRDPARGASRQGRRICLWQLPRPR